METTLAMLEELDVEVAGSSSSLQGAYSGITKTNPNLVLLDVEIGSHTSFELLSKFESIDFKVIFITAHQKYAIDAFKFSAVDFLLKPLSFTALESAIQKAQDAGMSTQEQSLETLGHNLNNTKSRQKIILKTQDKIWVLELNEIVHCESDLSYTIFHTAKEQIMVSKTMGYYEDLLVPYGFYRVHKSHLVNLDHVRKIHKGDGGEAELSNGSVVPISQRKKEDFLKTLDQQGIV